MASLERQFGVGMAGLAGASLLTGAVMRWKGRRERARRYMLHERPDGSLVEVDVRIPPQAERVVLLDNGLGTPHEYWDWVCEALPPDLGYVKFNRPGYGLSSSPAGYGLEHHFALLQELRDTFAGGLPLVLAGHSLGGYLVAAYASRHPGAARGVTSVVMVDATDVAHLRSSRRSEVDRWSRQSMLMERAYAMAGVAAFRPALNKFETYRQDVNRSSRAFLAEPRTWAMAHRDYRDAMTYPELTSLDLPLTVVTAENNQGDNDAHRVVQSRMATLSERSRHRFVEGSDHETILSVRGFAEQVAKAIADEPPTGPAGPESGQAADGRPADGNGGTGEELTSA